MDVVDRFATIPTSFTHSRVSQQIYRSCTACCCSTEARCGYGAATMHAYAAAAAVAVLLLDTAVACDVEDDTGMGWDLEELA